MVIKCFNLASNNIRNLFSFALVFLAVMTRRESNFGDRFIFQSLLFKFPFRSCKDINWFQVSFPLVALTILTVISSLIVDDLPLVTDLRDCSSLLLLLNDLL